MSIESAPLRRYAKVLMLKTALYDFDIHGEPIIRKLWVPIPNDTVRNLFTEFVAAAMNADNSYTVKSKKRKYSAPSKPTAGSTDDTATSKYNPVEPA